MPKTQPCQSVLVVEDDPDIAETLVQLLEFEGYHTFHATNGKEALTLLAKIPSPCLILLDLMMPVMNGWEFLSTLRKVPENMIATIPVVIVSAATDSIRSAQRQAEGFIKKPIDLETLFRCVQTYCGLPPSTETTRPA